MKQIAAGIFTALLCTTSAQAALMMSFQESGGSVLGTMSGSIDLAGMVATPGFVSAGAGVSGFEGAVSFGDALALQTGYFNQLSGPTSFGSGGFIPAQSTGDAVFLYASLNVLWLPAAYESGASLAATLLLQDVSYLDLGVSAGDVVYTLSSGDTLTVSFLPTPGGEIPLPGSLPLAFAALGALGWVQRRASTKNNR